MQLTIVLFKLSILISINENFKILNNNFISLTTPIKADLNTNLLNQLEDGGKLIFIRHAYAPGGGDPDNFNLNDCSTQRNLNYEGENKQNILVNF